MGSKGPAGWAAASMAALSIEQRAAARSAAGSDLKLLLDREQVSTDFSDLLYHAGISNVRQFAAFASDAADLKATLREQLMLDPGADLGTRVLVSKIMVAWESAKARANKVAEAEADSEVRKEPKPLRATGYFAMKDAF